MSIRRSTLLATAAALLLAPEAYAQRAARATSIQLAPYAGYLISGKALEGPLGTSLSNAAGAIGGAQLAVTLAPGIALVGNVAYASPDVRAGIPIFGDVSVGSSEIWLYDAGFQLSLPERAGGLLPISPFVQGGVGSMRYSVSSGPVTGEATNLAWNVGAGADVALGRHVSVRLFAKDYIGKFDFKDATGFDVNGETAHHVALGMGLRLDF